MSRILLAQTYNCAEADNSAYGESAYGTCAGESDGGSTPTPTPTPGETTTTQPGSVGAPNTGEFFGFVTGGAFSIVLPLVVAVVIVTAAMLVALRKKRRAPNQR